MMIIDRIEDGIAVIEKEDGTFLQIEAERLPCGAKEGSVLRKTDEGFMIDSETEKMRKAKMLELQKKMFGKNR